MFLRYVNCRILKRSNGLNCRLHAKHLKPCRLYPYPVLKLDNDFILQILFPLNRHHYPIMASLNYCFHHSITPSQYSSFKVFLTYSLSSIFPFFHNRRTASLTSAHGIGRPYALALRRAASKPRSPCRAMYDSRWE